MHHEYKEGTTEAHLAAEQRWGLTPKGQAVLRVLRGEPIATVSRELGVDRAWLRQLSDDALEGMPNDRGGRFDDGL